MSISVACPSCERKFQAPPQFEGKRVKCKGCGVVFAIPSSSGQEASGEFEDDSALNNLASSIRDSSTVNRSRGSADESDNGESSTHRDATAGRQSLAPNILTFNYPGSDDVDRWLPACLTVLCLLLLGDAVATPDTHDALWLAVTRFATMVVFYSMLIFPLTWMMVKKAAKESKYAMPPQAQFRCFAAYTPTLLIAGWLFSQQNGGFFIPLVGCILGLLISSALLWLLFRVRETDVTTYCMQAAGGFAGGLFASILLILLLNLGTGMVVSDNKAQKSVPSSPYAGSLSWIEPLPAPASDDSQKHSSSPSPFKTVITKVTKPEPTVVSSSGLVSEIESGKITGVIDAVIEPFSNSPQFAILRNGQSGIAIEPWTANDWKKLPGTLQLAPGAAKKFVISTDGKKLAWIAEFPRLSVQIWSFGDASVTDAISLDKSQGTADLIGFVDTDKLLIERGSPRPAGAAPITSGKPDTSSATPAAPEVDPAQADPDSVFGGFKLNPTELARQKQAARQAAADRAAHQTVVTPAPVTPAPAAGSGDDYPPVHAMSIIDVSSGTSICDFGLPDLVSDPGSSSQAKAPLHLGVNAAISTAGHRLAVSVTSQDVPTLLQYDLQTGKRLADIKINEVDPSQSGGLTGISYSNDGTKLASLFEHNEIALLLIHDAATGKKDAEHEFPYGPLEGAPHSQPENGAIAWLDPSPLLLLYGQGFISSKNFIHVKIADLGLGTVITQRMLDGHRIQLLIANNGGRQVEVIDLNPLVSDSDPKP